MYTSKIRTWERTSQFNDRSGVTLTKGGLRDARRIYRDLRENEKVQRPGARMTVVHALAAGQRDMETRVRDALRSI